MSRAEVKHDMVERGLEDEARSRAAAKVWRSTTKTEAQNNQEHLDNVEKGIKLDREKRRNRG